MNLPTARTELHSELISITGETITISPAGSGDDMTGVDALRGASGVETHNTAMDSYTLTAEYVDWLIEAENLNDGYIPSVNDVVTDANGNDYRVVQNQDTKRCFRWSSSQRLILRIHSKPEN